MDAPCLWMRHRALLALPETCSSERFTWTPRRVCTWPYTYGSQPKILCRAPQGCAVPAASSPVLGQGWGWGTGRARGAEASSWHLNIKRGSFSYACSP